MCTIHIGIRHDDDLIISESFEIKIIFDSGTYSRDQCLHFIIGHNLLHNSLFGVQDLTSQWEDGLEVAIASLFCATSR